MAGLLSSAQQPAQGQPTEQPRNPNGAQNQQSEQTVVDSQEAYDLAAGQMLNFVYDEQGIQALTKMIGSAPSPDVGMARLFGRLLMMTTQSAAMAGKRLPPAMVLQAGIEAVRAMSEVAQSKGLIDKANEKEITETAFYEGIALFGAEAKSEALTDDEREQYAVLLEKAQELEQSGKGLPTESGRQQPQEMTS